MELIVRIVEQGAVQEREFLNKQGVTEKFAVMPFVVQHGTDTFYAEMVQEQARKQGALSRDFYYVATLQSLARPWTDQQGVKRYENRLMLTKISVL